MYQPNDFKLKPGRQMAVLWDAATFSATQAMFKKIGLQSLRGFNNQSSNSCMRPTRKTFNCNSIHHNK